MTRRDTPGRGLEQVLESGFTEVERSTQRACKHCGAPMTRCPACNGSTFEELVPLAGGGDNTKYGEYAWKKCGWCDGEAFVSSSKAERWHLQQPSDLPPAPK
jgi:hypothetical protein